MKLQRGRSGRCSSRERLFTTRVHSSCTSQAQDSICLPRTAFLKHYALLHGMGKRSSWLPITSKRSCQRSNESFCSRTDACFSMARRTWCSQRTTFLLSSPLPSTFRRERRGSLKTSHRGAPARPPQQQHL